jgi:hypothetical protein
MVFSNHLLHHFPTILGFMAFNVPAVYDVLRLRIRACVARPATAKCAGENTHKGACADCVFLEAKPL